MKHLKKITMILLFAFFWVSCNELIIDESYNGKSIQLSKRSVLTLRLAGNPTTGYGWSIDSAGLVELVGEPDYKPSSDMIGAGGTYTFRFRLIDKGESKLTMSYGRKWDVTAEPAKKFEITIVSD